MYCSGFGGIHYIMYTCIREQLGTLLVKLIILHIYLPASSLPFVLLYCSVYADCCEMHQNRCFKFFYFETEYVSCMLPPKNTGVLTSLVFQLVEHSLII